jgi:calcineurin-like phosphoesterase family protein
MKRLAIADNHFQHFNIIAYESRPYFSVEEMDLDMIEKWNSVVHPDDIVFHLGDIALANIDYLIWLSYQLHGEIHLVKGNHDKKSNTQYQTLGWKTYNKPIVWFKENVVLSHRPQIVDAHWLNIHGHTHSKGENDKNHYCVSVENINYTPVDLDELIRSLRG